ncbi:MAG: hypothetical protein K6G78_07060 [bacterium]|nr:hypothetical protein [bacterium]
MAFRFTGLGMAHNINHRVNGTAFRFVKSVFTILLAFGAFLVFLALLTIIIKLV